MSTQFVPTPVITSGAPYAAHYGATPVPWTVSWSEEEVFSLGVCPWARRLAIVQTWSPKSGRPKFAKPHSVRQRACIALNLCDVCGKSLAHRTKVSLSQARPQPHSVRGFEVLQVEPMVHRECAVLSVLHCPGLRRHIEAGIFRVRQVTRHETQFAIMSPEYVETITGRAEKAVGHAKVCLKRWIDRDLEWLERTTQGAPE